MIIYIDTQLRLWAEWRRSGHTRLGYPRRSAFVVGGGGGQALITDEDALAVDRSVAALDPILHQLVECYYISMRSCTAKEIAQHLHCSRDTVYDRLHRTHIAVMGYLQDIAADIPVPPWRESEVA